MRHTIHRGQHEIGGMCIEVEADDSSRILLELGMPLTQPDGTDFPRDTPQRPTVELVRDGVLKEVAGLYAHDGQAPGFLAILVTHAHLDHYGLAHHAHPGIPVYGSEGTVALLEAGRVFFPSNAVPGDLRTLPKTPLELGSITLTAIPVDHAAPDSRALLVEADGQRLLYTGDLRAHGRTGFRFENLLSDPRVQGVDWMLIEGTTLGSSGGTHGLQTEQDVEDQLVELAAQGQRLLAVVSSGQNLDRLVSCFRAARRSGRQLVVDPYQAYILTCLAPLSNSIPQFTWNDVRVSFSPYQVQRLMDAGLTELVYEMSREAKLTSDELAATPDRYLMACRGSAGVTKLLDKVGASNIELIWSLWKGYWDRGPAIREWADRNGVDAHFIHSGGHAWPEDLKRLVQAIEPKNVTWVHTDAFGAAQ